MSRQRKCRSTSAGALAVVVLGSLTCVGAAAAAATPATLAVNRACYVFAKARPLITITGSGYPAGQPVTILDKLGLDATTTANPAGQISTTVKAPIPGGLKPPGQEFDTITAEGFDPTTGAEYKGTTTTALSVVAALHGATKKRPGLQAFREKTRWKFSGFTGKHVYGHFTFGGKLVATEDFGKAKGACGILKVKRKLLPIAPRHKAYKVQIDSHKKFSHKTDPRIDLKLALLEF